MCAGTVLTLAPRTPESSSCSGIGLLEDLDRTLLRCCWESQQFFLLWTSDSTVLWEAPSGLGWLWTKHHELQKWGSVWLPKADLSPCSLAANPHPLCPNLDVKV